MELTIRLATASDSANLLTLLKQLSQESDTFCLAQDIETLDVVTEADNIEVLQQTRNNLMLVVADEQDQLYGIATAVASQSEVGTAEIGLAVLKAYQGNGLAQALLAELIDWGMDYSQLSELMLTVKASNQVAIHIYEKFGFKQMAQATQDDILMMRFNLDEG